MPATPRRTRSDALQNRERLLEVAGAVFAEQSLDTAPAAIAKRAGVGVGTLYRHFPTREALIEAVYRRRLTRVCEQAAGLLAGRTAAEATRAWAEHFLDYATAKSGMSEALNAVIASGATRTPTAAPSSPTPSPPCWRPVPGRLLRADLAPATSCSSWAA
ncbi:helix-turn-helix domain-containing protein [Streptomyces sp. M19]